MAVRLSDVSSIIGKKCIFCVFRPFNFYYYDGLQPKMSAGMIKLHECRKVERIGEETHQKPSKSVEL